MDFVDLLLNSGLVVGCAIGMFLAIDLHLLLPAEDVLIAQAMLVVLCSGLGLVVQLKADPRCGRDWGEGS